MRLIGALVLAFAFISPVQAAASGCDGGNPWLTECHVSNSGKQVDVSGTQTDHDESASEPTPDRDTPDASDSDNASEPDKKMCAEFLECRDSYAVGLLPDVTLADLASFVPARPQLSGEPDGVAIVGLPVNLVAEASELLVPGTLFDFDVVVRFVPTGFRFDHGDGTSHTSTSGGASWASLHQAEFTPTATSHVYRARGTYDVAVTVLYAASVDFGNGWRSVPGYVEATTSGYRVRAVEAHTALVDKTCLENPDGPGC